MARRHGGGCAPVDVPGARKDVHPCTVSFRACRALYGLGTTPGSTHSQSGSSASDMLLEPLIYGLASHLPGAVPCGYPGPCVARDGDTRACPRMDVFACPG